MEELVKLHKEQDFQTFPCVIYKWPNPTEDSFQFFVLFTPLPRMVFDGYLVSRVTAMLFEYYATISTHTGTISSSFLFVY